MIYSKNIDTAKSHISKYLDKLDMYTYLSHVRIAKVGSTGAQQYFGDDKFGLRAGQFLALGSDTVGVGDDDAVSIGRLLRGHDGVVAALLVELCHGDTADAGSTFAHVLLDDTG